MRFTWKYKSYCRKCGGYTFNLASGFLHDVRCYSPDTALRNLGMSVLADLGLRELETTADYLERMGYK